MLMNKRAQLFDSGKNPVQKIETTESFFLRQLCNYNIVNVHVSETSFINWSTFLNHFHIDPGQV